MHVHLVDSVVRAVDDLHDISLVTSALDFLGQTSPLKREMAIVDQLVLSHVRRQ